MNRRQFLSGSAAALAVSERALGSLANPLRNVSVRVDTRRTLGLIPADFVGLGYEISAVAIPGLLSAANKTYVQLVRTLSSDGVIRIGGNTSDYSSFAAKGAAVSAPKGSIVNEVSLRDLRSFLDATGWKLIWGLNLGAGDQAQAIVEAQAVAEAMGEKLLALEIGNEPDLFGGGVAHRPKSYSYADFLKEYRTFKAAVRRKLPEVRFAGPDVASATDWVTQFASDEASDLLLLTHHYYRECSGPTSTIDKLLHPDPKLAPKSSQLRAASHSSRRPYRICETNSFCGGGKPGVSDTFGAALWVLDFMFTLAYADCAGVNMETGVNQFGFISSYSPIAENGSGSFGAKPEYYGMLAFAQASQGKRLQVSCEAGGINLNAYAVQQPKHVAITLVNKDEMQDAVVGVTIPEAISRARAIRLTAPSLQSKEGVTLGGNTVETSGAWNAGTLEQVSINAGVCEVRVQAASAAILQLET